MASSSTDAPTTDTAAGAGAGAGAGATAATGAATGAHGVESTGLISLADMIAHATAEDAKPCPSASPTGSEEASVELFVPGRVCLFGEHSDWAGGFRRFNPSINKGFTIVCATNQGIHGTARRASTIRVEESNGHHFSVTCDRAKLLEEARAGGFWSYAAGCCHVMLTRFDVKGVDIKIDSVDLPIGKGLSSSAAICVFIAKAFSTVYDLKLSSRGFMEIAYHGEMLTPSKCGRMDQACAYNSCVLMSYDGDFLDVVPQPIGADIHMVVIDLLGKKDTVTILADLQAAYPTAEGKVQEGLHYLFGKNNETIVAAACKALKSGDAEALGKLMTQAQADMDKYATPACPSQLTAPLLHRVLQWPTLKPFIYGGKGVGAGGDGSCQLVCRDAQAQAQVVAIVRKELDMVPLTLSLLATA